MLEAVIVELAFGVASLGGLEARRLDAAFPLTWLFNLRLTGLVLRDPTRILSNILESNFMTELL
jgi:hypothetical protein